MLVLWILTFIKTSQSSPETIFISSPKTPPTLFTEFSRNSSIITLSSSNSSSIYNVLSSQDFSLLVDITFDREYSSVIDQTAEYFQVAYLTALEPDFSSSFPNRFYIHDKTENSAEAIYSIVEYLGLKDISLIYSSNYRDIKTSSLIKELYGDRIYLSISFDENLNLETANYFVQRMVKGKGIRRILIIGSGDSLKTLQTALQLKNVIKPGAQLLFYTKSPNKIFIDGALILTQEGSENSESYEESEGLLIKQALKKIVIDMKPHKILADKNNILNFLQEKYPMKYILNSFKILNIQEGAKVEVGVYNNSLYITSKIFYPGNIDYISNNEILMPITISIANGTSELVGNLTNPLVAYRYQGARYAVKRSNEKNDLKNFYLQLFPTNCGNMFYEHNLSVKCFSPILDKLGIAYLSSIWGVQAYGNALTLKSLNKFIPQISPAGIYDALDNKELFPEILKLSVTSTEYFSTGFLLMRAFGWNTANIFVSDNDSNYSLYLSVLKFVNEIGFIIANNPENRVIPANYTRNDFEKYKDHFKEAKNNRCRVFLLLANNIDHIIEGLYDVGLRKGDAIFFSGDFQFINYLKTEDEKYLKKREELIEDSLVFSIKEWNGELGEQLYMEMSSMFPDVSMMCLTYDSVTLVKESINYIIKTGNDYEDLHVLSSVMRNSRISGCVGTIYFNRESNSRGFSLFIFYQVRKNLEDNSWHYEKLAVVDKYSSQSITFITSVEWPMKDINYPSNFKEMSECKYDDFLIISSEKGRIALIVFSSYFFLVSIICSYFSSKKFKTLFSPLTTKKSISISDILYILSIFLWFCQIISLCPQNYWHTFILKDLHRFIGLNFIDYYNIKHTNFWHYIYFLLGFCYLWPILCIMVSYEVHLKYEKNYFIQKFNILCQYAFPFISNVWFVPMTSSLMEVYNCIEGIGDDISQSYNQRACFEFCYTGFHKNIVILTTFSLSIYMIFAVFYKPIWETSQPTLNLNIKSSYQGIFTIFLVILIMIQKNLKSYSQIIIGSIDTGILGLMIVISLITKPFNYMRVNVILYIMLIFAFWNSFISIIFEVYEEDYMVIIWFGGFVFIMIIGALRFFKYPVLLVGGKDISIPILFQFQFGVKKTKYSLTQIRFNTEGVRINT